MSVRSPQSYEYLAVLQQSTCQQDVVRALLELSKDHVIRAASTECLWLSVWFRT